MEANVDSDNGHLDNAIEAMVTKPSWPLDLIHYRLKGETDVPGKYKTCCSGLQGVTGLDDLEDALAVFVQGMQMQRQGKHTLQNQQY